MENRQPPPTGPLRKPSGDPGGLGTAGRIDAAGLGDSEREVFERWVDRDGLIGDRDIDTLLRQNLLLRRLIADLVASAGHPKPGPRNHGYVAEVPTRVIEDVAPHGDFSHIDDPEAGGKGWF